MNAAKQTKLPNQKTPQTIPKSDSKLIAFIFIAFFSTFILVDIVYIYISSNTWRGVVTEDSYQKGLDYNQNISLARNQQSLGWDFHIKYIELESKSGNLQVKLLDKDNNLIKNANLTAKITRPVQQGYDFSVDLAFNNKNNSYESKVLFPLVGQWDIEIKAVKDGDLYQDGKRFVIK